MRTGSAGENWKHGRLQDLVLFQRGFDTTQALQRPGPFPVISSSGISSYHDEFKVKGPGVVIGRKGTLGSIHYAEGDYWPHDTTLWSRDFNGNNPRFTYYFLHTIDFRRFDVGNSNPTLNRNHIHGLPVLIPPIEIQGRIVDVLSAYDDLIENNRQRMVLLEEAARQLYREWFVSHRFPGREHTPTWDGVLAGWGREPLLELCESVDYGYTASATMEEVGPKYLRITDIVSDHINWSTVPYCQIEDSRMERFILRKGDIVVARTGATVGYAKQLHKRHPGAVFASYLVRLRLKPAVESLRVGIFVKSQSYKRYGWSNVGGAAQPNANARVLAGASILVPPRLLQERFRDLVEPLVDQREILQLQCEKLRAARDLLLPRLMNGEVSA